MCDKSPMGRRALSRLRPSRSQSSMVRIWPSAAGSARRRKDSFVPNGASPDSALFERPAKLVEIGELASFHLSSDLGELTDFIVGPRRCFFRLSTRFVGYVELPLPSD